MGYFNNLGIATKLAAVIGLPLAFLTVLSLLSLQASNTQFANQQQVEQTNKVLLNLSQIEKSLIDLETGQRGYLITGKDNFLEPFNRARQSLDQQFEQLKSQVADNPGQIRRLQQVEVLTESWMNQAGLPEIKLRRQVNKNTANTTSLQTVLRAGTGKSILDQIRAELNSMDRQFSIANNDRALNLTLTIAKAMVDMETGQRGYLITGEQTFLEPFRSGKLTLTEAVDQLHRLLDNAYNREKVKANLDKLKQISARWLLATTPEIELRRQIDLGKRDFAALQAAVRSESGKTLLDSFRVTLDNIYIAFIKANNIHAQNNTLNLAKAMVDMETGQRGFLLTGENAFLEPYTLGQRQLREHFTILQSLIGNAYNAAQMRRSLQKVSQLAREWQRQAADPEIEIRNSMNLYSTTMNDVVTLIEAQTGKRLMDQLRLHLEQLKDEERLLQQQRKTLAETASSNLQWTIILGTLAVIAISILISRFIVQGITNQLMTTLKGVERIADADYSQPVIITASDQIGHLGMAVNRLLDTLRNTAQIAKRIAEGDYSFDIVSQGRNDELGLSLQTMTEVWTANQKSLEQERATLRQQEWIKSNYATLIEKIQSCTDIQDLAETLLSNLVPMLGAHLGLFYERRNNPTENLTLIASYAFSQRKHLANQFVLGEGLVGQCALEKELIFLSNVPSDYVQVSSGSGDAVPKQLVVFPIIFEKQLIAVVEIGSTTNFTVQHEALIELMQNNVGVIINNIQSRLRTETLLQQSQEQGNELKRQQEELQAANENLEEQTQQLRNSEETLKQQSEELAASNEELREKQVLLKKQKSTVEAAKREVDLKANELALASKYKSEFLANMSHELRTPLNSLLILSKSLADNKEGNLSPRQKEDARIVNEGGNELLVLINDIMDLSKVEAGMLDITMGNVTLAGVAKNLDNLFSRTAEQKQLTYTTHIAPAMVETIFSDNQRLVQIVKNFISNALKFTETGEISVNFHPVDKATTFRQSQLTADTAIGISVTDTGIGIPEEKQQAIFEAFQQADGSTSRRYGGTGLGLTISRELSRLLGGEIQLNSQPGKGSTFTVFLPKTWDEAIHGQENDTDPGPSGKPKQGLKANRTIAAEPSVIQSVQTTDNAVNNLANNTPAKQNDKTIPNDNWLPDDRRNIHADDNILLIIEDDPRFAKILQQLGEEKQQKVLLADKGRDGLLLANEFIPSGILLDMGLPDINGLEVLDQLKDNLTTRHIPVHVISAGEFKVSALEHGAVSFLTKPATQESLQTALDLLNTPSKQGIKSILIIEDDTNSQTAIKRLLESDDIILKFAGDMASALEQLDADSYDCIILDLGLPDVEGTEVLNKITSHTGAQDTPIIVYTGREISDAEHSVLKEFSASIVIKGAESPERLLDDVSLFLHRANSQLPSKQQDVIKMLHDQDAMLTNRRVLLVDDDMRNIYAIKSELSDLGLNVTPAENGQVAIDTIKAAKQPYELILMDIMMPIKDGYDAMQEIRQLPNYANTPILALTAKAMPEDRQKCIDAGASDYLIKPVDIAKLTSMLRVWLYQRT
ncbi:MAG: CHASE3 domain-containing protein [Pseudomonadales bacterium]|nr:CHASE3 domain-containing protein [Pseudomonadales bacterium]